ncbi:phenylalanine--tRNA ligase beta subunit-related protein, partial [Coprococcus eutactus]|uniref:phenylalanine--tRNA ligase beta subunit-related protein n=1 Tax=Coprococcus eutactus TaxID=33043 RepID=UPI00210A8CA7
GQERKLDLDLLMICDGEKEIGIAVIMGGENSIVTDSIDTLLFEAACLDGKNIRLSSRRIGLATDAAAK